MIGGFASGSTSVSSVRRAEAPSSLGRAADEAAAVVQAFFAGQGGAAAVAGVLSGRVNLSGRLPVQVPREPGGQPASYLSPILGGPDRDQLRRPLAALAVRARPVLHLVRVRPTRASTTTRPTACTRCRPTQLASSSREVRLTVAVDVIGEARVVGHDRVLSTPVTVEPA